jgi:hypothetical protein
VPVVNTIGETGTDAAQQTDAPTTTQEIHRCVSESGRCVFIDGITRDGDTYVVRYTTIGYAPKINGGPESRHIHFYFDTVPIDQAGSPAPGSGWVVYDTDENGELVYRFAVGDVPSGATQLCASVANVRHELDEQIQDCEPLP